MLDQLSEWEGTAAALVWLRNYCPNEERSWFHCQEKAFGDVGVLCVGGAGGWIAFRSLAEGIRSGWIS